jgi:hypothetical protein
MHLLHMPLIHAPVHHLMAVMHALHAGHLVGFAAPRMILSAFMCEHAMGIGLVQVLPQQAATQHDHDAHLAPTPNQKP